MMATECGLRRYERVYEFGQQKRRQTAAGRGFPDYEDLDTGKRARQNSRFGSVGSATGEDQKKTFAAQARRTGAKADCKAGSRTADAGIAAR